MKTIHKTQKISHTVIAAIAGASVALTGCAMTDEDIAKAQGSMVGITAGIAAGLLLGDSKKGAIIGAAIGLVAGIIYAEHVANKKLFYLSNESYMTDVIAESDTMIAGSQLQRKILEANIVEYGNAIEHIQSLQQDEKAYNEALTLHQQDVQKNLDDTEKFLIALDTEIKIQTETLETERVSLPIELVSQSESKIALLREELSKQELLKKQLASFDRKRLY